MEIADYLPPARSLCPVRIDQCLGVDLKMCFGCCVNINSFARFANAIARAQKNAATFARMRARRRLCQCGQSIPCHLQSHRHVG